MRCVCVCVCVCVCARGRACVSLKMGSQMVSKFSEVERLDLEDIGVDRFLSSMKESGGGRRLRKLTREGED